MAFWRELRRLEAPEAQDVPDRVLACIPPESDFEQACSAARSLIQAHSADPAAGAAEFEQLVQAGDCGLALGLVSQGVTLELAREIAQIASQPGFPVTHLSDRQRAGVLAGLASTPQATPLTALDDFRYLAAQLSDPDELTHAADFLVRLRHLVPTEREARLVFTDLTRRDLDEERGELLLDVLGKLPGYAAARPVWSLIEQLPAARSRECLDRVEPHLVAIRSGLTGAQQTRLLECQLQEPLPDELWKPLLECFHNSRRQPLSNQLAQELFQAAFDPTRSPSQRRETFERLKVLSPGGEHLQAAWKTLPLVRHTSAEELAEWARALDLLAGRFSDDQQLAAAMEQLVRSQRHGESPVDLARLLRDRRPDRFEDLRERVASECGFEGTPGQAMEFLARLEQSTEAHTAEQCWEEISRPVRGETLPERIALFGSVLEKVGGRGPTGALEVYRRVARSPYLNDSLGATLEAMEPLIREIRTDSYEMVDLILRPGLPDSLAERVGAGCAFVVALGGHAPDLWTRVAEKLEPGQKLSQVAQPIASVGECLRGDRGMLDRLFAPLERTTLAERAGLLRTMTDTLLAGGYSGYNAVKTLGEAWDMVVAARQPQDDAAACLRAAARLTAQSRGEMRSLARVLNLGGAQSLEVRLSGFAELMAILKNNLKAALEIWERTPGEMRPGDTFGDTAAAVAQLKVSLRDQSNWALQQLQEMRKPGGPGAERSLTTLVRTLLTVTLNRTTNLTEAMRLLPEDLPAPPGIQEKDQHVVVGGAVVRRRQDEQR